MALSSVVWSNKPLSELDAQEWESLCDGCGRCCLVKLEDEDTGEVHYTDLACRFLDLNTCRCTDYARRTEVQPDCVRLAPDNLAAVGWMPSTCAYRRLAEGQPLPAWHPLLTGDSGSTGSAGMSACAFAASETTVADEAFEEHVIELD